MQGQLGDGQDLEQSGAEDAEGLEAILIVTFFRS